MFSNIFLKWTNYILVYIYKKNVKKFGFTPRGLFWNSKESQENRFKILNELLLKYTKVKNDNIISIADIGCGYGKFFEFLRDKLKKSTFQYQGCDLNNKLIDYCTKSYSDKNCKFYKKSSPKSIVDFSIMSGTFNLSVTDDVRIWEKYILKNLTNIWKQTNKIMAFNLLNENERKIKKGLYYTNKNWIKDICEQNFGKTEIIFSSILPDDILIIVKT